MKSRLSVLVRSCLLVCLGTAFAITLLSSTSLAQDASPTPDSSNAALKGFMFFPTETGFGTYFDLTIAAGSTSTASALLVNTGEISQELHVFPIDAFTAQNGGFGNADYGKPIGPVTTWLDFPDESIMLEPGDSKEFVFTVAVPAGTAPGEYLTAVAAEQATPSKAPGSGSFQFTQRLRFVIPVLITVPGKTTFGFRINSISLNVQQESLLVAVDLENTGDVRVRPEGSVQLLDTAGKLIVSIPIKMDSIYAHDSTRLTVGVPEPIPPGPYTVRVNLTDTKTGATATAEQSGLEAAAAATPVPQQVVITTATATPKPAADNVQFAEVAATIVNNGEAITNAQLSLVASKDGAEVERFPISQSLSLPAGETPVTTRYIPAEGWSSGSWTFELLVETVDPSGAAVVMARLPVDGTITIP